MSSQEWIHEKVWLDSKRNVLFVLNVETARQIPVLPSQALCKQPFIMQFSAAHLVLTQCCSCSRPRDTMPFRVSRNMR